jgi:hypothetical protein
VIRFILAGRQTGKTERLLEWLGSQTISEPQSRVIVCHSDVEAVRLRKICDERGWLIAPSQILSAESVRRGGLRGHAVLVAVDNLDLVLPQLLGAQIDVVTSTIE